MKAHEQALLFLAKAAEDETLLDEVSRSEKVSDGIVGFHCQQAAEKMLKAVLSEMGVRFRWTHDLRELMDILFDHGHTLPEDLADLDVLTPYGAFFRYQHPPAGAPFDRNKAIDLIRRLRAWSEHQIGPGAEAPGH